MFGQNSKRIKQDCLTILVFMSFLVSSCSQSQSNLSLKDLEPTALPVPVPTLAPLPKAQVNIAALNVREGPGTEYRRITVVTKLDELTVLGQTDTCTWLKIITAQGMEGWVSAQYVTLNSECDYLAILSTSSNPTLVGTATSVIIYTKLSDVGVKLIRPLNTVLRGQVTFEWESRMLLEANQAFELVLWPSDQAPIVSGFSPVGASIATKVSVNLEQAADSLPQLQSGKEYKWGVLLVAVNPYQRLKFLGDEHQFHFEQSESTLKRHSTSAVTLLPPPPPVPTSDPVEPNATPLPAPTSPSVSTPTVVPTLAPPSTPVPTLTLMPPTPTSTPTVVQTLVPPSTPVPTVTSTPAVVPTLAPPSTPVPTQSPIGETPTGEPPTVVPSSTPTPLATVPTGETPTGEPAPP